MKHFFILLSIFLTLLTTSLSAQSLMNAQELSQWGRWLYALNQRCVEYYSVPKRKIKNTKMMCECKAEEFITGEEAIKTYDRFGLEYRDRLLKNLVQDWAGTTKPGKAARFDVEKQIAQALNFSIDRVCKERVEERIKNSIIAE